MAPRKPHTDYVQPSINRAEDARTRKEHEKKLANSQEDISNKLQETITKLEKQLQTAKENEAFALSTHQEGAYHHQLIEPLLSPPIQHQPGRKYVLKQLLY